MSNRWVVNETRALANFTAQRIGKSRVWPQ
jgi:hypothetical protein